MTDEIRPALSAEEWAGRHAKRALRVFQDARGGITVASESGGAGTRDPATLHVIAALALYGQPFGFTWEDVERVNLAGGMVARAGAETVADNLFTLAAKIAALLPPREEG